MKRKERTVEELLRLLLGGGARGAQAASELVGRYEGRLLYAIRRQFPGLPEGVQEDVKQSAFAHLLAIPQRIQARLANPALLESSGLWCWLWQMAFDAALTELRGDHGLNPDGATAFEVAMGGLPADERAVYAAQVGGEHPDDVAARLGWPRKRVYGLLIRARKRIARLLHGP